jgi:guanine nucleotide-binding protein subunit alpha
MLPPFQFTEELKALALRLCLLGEIQRELEKQIGAGAIEPHDLSTSVSITDPAPFVEEERLAMRSPSPRRPNEFFVRSHSGWKERLSKFRPRLSLEPDHPKRSNKWKQTSLLGIIAECAKDIEALWADEVVQAVLKRRDMRLEDSSGLSVTFFLFVSLKIYS